LSTDPSNIRRLAPAWNAREVVVFNGQHDTRISDGGDYGTRTLASLFAIEPGNADKLDGLAFIPSTYSAFDARTHAVQKASGSFVALTGDVDSGDHELRNIETLVRSFAGEAAWLIFSTAHARENSKRWRIIIPLDKPMPFEDWDDAQNAFYNFMDLGGVTMDRALARAGQPVYLPNIPDYHAKTGELLRHDDGTPIFYHRLTTGTNASGLTLTGLLASGMAAIARKRDEDERERKRIRAEAEQRRANRPRSDDAPVMEDFNRNNPIANLLELYGYRQCPRDGQDWRSPKQQGETYATRVFDDHWISLSGSDSSSGLGARCASGCFGDAYDLFVHYEHGGDHKSAFRALYQERRASQPQTYSAPPPVHPDDPGADFMDDYVDCPLGDYEDADGAPLPDTKTGPRLPFFWFHEAQPNLDANDFVEGLLTSTAMSVIYGPSNCGKTFFVVDLALHVALGWEWRGRQVDKGAIVYLSLEGAQGIRNRLAAFRQHHGLGIEQLPFIAMPQPVNLLNEDADAQAVIELVLHVEAETGMPVAMVIVDTLSRAMAGGNENSPEDMTAIVGNCDRIRDATKAHVCIVHHSGKDEAKGARGHSSLRAATDTEIEITRDEGAESSNVRVAKQRDLEAADPFGFALKGVALGTNRRGKDVTSCVVVQAEKHDKAGLNREQVRQAMTLMIDAWTEGRPLSHKPQARDTGRYAPLIFTRELGGSAGAWKEHIDEWIYNGAVSFEAVNSNTKVKGLRVLRPII
jgi:hypothetical protein